MQSPEELLAELKALRADIALDNTALTAKPKPLDYTTTANVSYYGEKFALWLKLQLDSMKPDRDMLLRCNVIGLKLRSLEAKCYQAFRYLVDHLDDADRHYARLRASINIVKYTRNKKWPNLLKHEEGIILSWTANPSTVVLGEDNAFVGEDIDPIQGGSIKSNWREELDYFITHSIEGEKFDRDDLLMEQEEFDSIYAKLVTLGNFLISPKSNITHLIIINTSILNQL